jgi:uncharacterized protein
LNAIDDEIVEAVRRRVEALYAQRNSDVPFHGWHHIMFVSSKVIAFARELGADDRLSRVAALVHDVNYLVDPTTNAGGGAALRKMILSDAGLSSEIIQWIERVVLEAETNSRHANISPEAKALSDADTLFKALPVTPVVLAPLYLKETGKSLKQLATEIVSQQGGLRDQDIYFYSDSARERYAVWGEVNIQLWRCVLESLDDPDVITLLGNIPTVRP